MKKETLLDLQSADSLSNSAINQAGISDYKIPISFDDSKNVQHTVGTFDMSVSLTQNERGTHMSRFIEYMEKSDRVLSLERLKDMTADIKKLLEANDAFIKVAFSYFLKKTAPVSKIESIIDYHVEIETNSNGESATQTMTIKVPVTSLCPCSKGISDYGAHNQRSIITIKVALNESIQPYEFIRQAEEVASCQLYGILKRVDEKFVTEEAYDNPKFAEDLVRDVALYLDKVKDEKKIYGYKVRTENYESIHNHNAYAMIESSPTVTLP